MHVLLFQKTNDDREQVIKKRKKKEENNLEDKNPKKNRVPKQGWESWQYNITFFNVWGCPYQMVKLYRFIKEILGFNSLNTMK